MTMTTTGRTLSSNVRPVHLHEAPVTPSSLVIDFVPERDRVREKADKAVRQLEIEKEIRKAVAQRKRSIELYDPVEDWLYSLIPASAIVALLLGVLGLLDSKTTGPQATANKNSTTVERPLSSHSKDGKF
jgi:hypothetical protein